MGPRAQTRLGFALVSGFVLLMAVALLAPGIFYLSQREGGTRARATVGDCQVSGSGRYESTHCTGTWVVGGSLLAGGRVVYGTINGVDSSDVGKTIDVTLHGDTAYSRGLLLPALLIGFGVVPAVGFVVLVVARLRRGRRVPG